MLFEEITHRRGGDKKDLEGMKTRVSPLIDLDSLLDLPQGTYQGRVLGSYSPRDNEIAHVPCRGHNPLQYILDLIRTSRFEMRLDFRTSSEAPMVQVKVEYIPHHER